MKSQLEVPMDITVFKAAGIDLDATLLDGSTLSPLNKAEVIWLQEQGLTIVLATGRNFHQAIRYYNELGLTGPAVTSDGALVSIPTVRGNILSERSLVKDATAVILQEALKREITCLNFFRHGIYCSSKFDWNEQMERHREIGRHFRLTSIDAMLRHAVYKTLLHSADAEALDALQAHVLAGFGEVVDAIRNSPNILEFVQKGVSKVSGLESVAAHLGIDANGFVVFGDGVNDVGMFGWAGLSVCMNHGHALAKAAAKVVAPESDPAENFAAAVASVFRPAATLVV
jgi:Cof subfamily protein (haloacid dehalogenase superfamily)